MAEINELEKKADESWWKAVNEKEMADRHSTIDSGSHTIEATYHQNVTLYYQNQIMIQNQKELLEYLKNNKGK